MIKEIIVYHAIKKLVSGEMDKGSWGYALDEDEIVSWEEVLNWINQNMQDATSEEQKSTHDYIKSISKPTGVNFFEQQTAEDCVSRDDAFHVLEEFELEIEKGNWDSAYPKARARMMSLPSVQPQPKRGKWIEVEVHNCHATLKCSVCDRTIEPTFTFGEYSYEDIKEFYPYCHCGAEMGGSESE